jgi:hypothetical protein
MVVALYLVRGVCEEVLFKKFNIDAGVEFLLARGIVSPDDI